MCCDRGVLWRIRNRPDGEKMENVNVGGLKYCGLKSVMIMIINQDDAC